MTPFPKDNAWFFSKMMQSDFIFHPCQISYVYERSKCQKLGDYVKVKLTTCLEPSLGPRLLSLIGT